MNVFILSTGRCGSTTFVRACSHIQNFTSAHESRHGLLGDERLRYGDNHIESDNRLSWFLGRLDETYGKEAFYIHLTRDHNEISKSYIKRYQSGLLNVHSYSIINPYSRNIVGNAHSKNEPFEIGLDYCKTVDSNISFFLRDKPNVINVSLEEIKPGFREFWERIGAKGNLDAALNEWDVRHNAGTKAPILSGLKLRLKYLGLAFSG